MADLRDGQVEVNEEMNRRVLGPAGTKERAEASCYLNVGGSRNPYVVTINFETGHFCTQHNGKPCRGNLTGIRAGAIHERDTNNPKHWCKHVKAALRQPELIAEAQELTYIAFHPVAKPAPKAKKAKAEVSGAAARLAKLEAEAEAIREEVAGKVAELVAEYGIELVREAM